MCIRDRSKVCWVENQQRDHWCGGKLQQNSILQKLLKNPHAQVRTCSVGGLKLDERLLALFVTWILTPRGSNHYVLTEEDLVYIYCIMNKIKINWIHIIKEHMKKFYKVK